MRPDVIALRKFYQRPLGRATARCLVDQVQSLWPDLSGQHVAGIGFAPPILDRLSGNAASRVALMPAPQGVMHWPDSSLNASALVEEQDLPLPDGSFDRVILAHALEVADHMRGLLREVWRILSPGGRLIVIVPRRRGMWAGFENTPFGSGQPFSSYQVTQTLANQLLPVAHVRRALFLPPMSPLARGGIMKAAEKIGPYVLRGFAGVLVVEAEKQVYGAITTEPRPAKTFRVTAARPRLVPPLATPRADHDEQHTLRGNG